MNLDNAVIVIAIVFGIIPFMLYAWAYKLPVSCKAVLGQKRLAQIGQTLRILNLVVSVPFFVRAGINLYGLCIGIPLMFVGQYLVEVVYGALGDCGVYYGCELGIITPRRISGFPFTMSDPMYKGSMLTLLGGLLCFNLTRDLMLITISWFVGLFLIICVENTTPGVA